MSVTAASGFVAAGLHCGIKPSGEPDLAVVATSDGRPVPAGATFTKNLACAGPVRVSKAHIAANHQVSAVVLNSGNANCATGTDADVATETCALAAAELGCAPTEVLVCSTGLIGMALDPAPLRSGVPRALAAAVATEEAGAAAARAIMTTDTVPKQALVRSTDGSWVVGGMAKGAAMIAPNMATMLAVVTTDAEVPWPVVQTLLSQVVPRTFNRVAVDGCTSTNDTVALLASGAAGPPADFEAFCTAVDQVCLDLARQMAADAEGHTKVVTVEVVGARNAVEADRAARQVAGSALVKCSFYGNDPYWGRVLSELGVAGVALDVDAVTIAYDDVVVSRGLGPTGADAGKIVAQPEFTLRCDLGVGRGEAWLLTNDLTHAYIDENTGGS